MEEYLQGIIYQNKCTQKLIQCGLICLGISEEQLERIQKQIQRDVEKEMEEHENEKEK